MARLPHSGRWRRAGIAVPQPKRLSTLKQILSGTEGLPAVTGHQDEDPTDAGETGTDFLDRC